MVERMIGDDSEDVTTFELEVGETLDELEETAEGDSEDDENSVEVELE